MDATGRRTFLSTLTPIVVALSGGCSLQSGRSISDTPIPGRTVRTTDPVRTEGEPLRVARPERAANDLADLLKEAVSTGSECLVGEPPVEATESAVVVTTRTVVRSLGQSNVAFPSPGYAHLKRITPRSIVSTSTDAAENTSDGTPVYIEAVLREGTSEETTPDFTDDCGRESEDTETA